MSRLGIAIVVSIWAAGCASSTVNAPPLHMTLPTARIVADGAPVENGVKIVAMPVQIGEWSGPGEIESKGAAPVAIRVYEEGVPHTKWFESPTVEPVLVKSDIWPRFDLHTVPMLPYGSFWLEVTNTQSAPMSFAPKDVHLVLGTEDLHATEDGGAILGRWKLAIQTLYHVRVSAPELDSNAQNLFLAFPRLEKPVEIAPGATWKGFVVFDIGNRYTADEYNRLLTRSAQGKLTVTHDKTELASVPFKTQATPLPVVCLPNTKTPSFINCEARVVEGTQTPSNDVVREGAVNR